MTAGTKRDCIFLVADRNMEAVFQGFLGRSECHRSLGCGPFGFDAREDLIRDSAGKDAGVYGRAHELLRPYLRSHRFAVVALDCEFGGSPGGAEIVRAVSARMERAGWPRERFCVVAIDPEIEVWIWQDNPHVATALRYDGPAALRAALRDKGWWADGVSKPERPKEALEWVLRQTRRPRSSALYREIASRVSVRACQDAAFQGLLETLRGWFPVEAV